MKPSLDNKRPKGWGKRSFVKKSASCSLEETCRSLRMPAWSFSLTIWQSMSKYLVLSWKTGLAAMWRALGLSHNNTGSLEHLTCKSLSKEVVLVIFGYQSINWFWTFNHWTLNFYSWEGKKWVKTLKRSRSGGWFRLGKVLSTLNDFGTPKEPLT